MTSKQFADWIEKRLKEVGVKKVIPKKKILDELFLEHYKTKLKEDVLNDHMPELMAKMERKINALEVGKICIPDDIEDYVKKAIHNKSITWEQAIKSLVIHKQHSISR